MFKDKIRSRGNDITLFLGGGMGNVLFQINFAENLLSDGHKVAINSSLVTNKYLLKLINWTHHQNTLNNLREICALPAGRYEEQKTPTRLLGFLPLISKLSKFENLKHSCPDDVELLNGVFGYFQNKSELNFKFVQRIKTGINDYCIRRNLVLASSDELVIHFRGGDYNLNSEFKQPSNFFEAQRELFEDFDKITIITNDVDKAVLNYSKLADRSKLTFKSSENSIDDFCYIASSKNLVISNSTFSWWASELSEAKIIYQPKVFFPHLRNWEPGTLKTRVSVY